MTYREYLHSECESTDLDNKEEVISLIQFLLQQAVENNDFALKLEDKLMSIMSAKEFEEWSKATANEMFKKELDNLPDSDFKEFALNNFDLITNDEMNFFETSQAIKEREDERKKEGE